MTDLANTEQAVASSAQAAKAELAAEPRADSGSRLQRVILPRPGDPLTVRALYVDEHADNPRRAGAPTRTTLRMPAQAEISFATYFNAFPASYWRRWTTLSQVELRLAVDGECRVDVYRSKADGAQVHVCGEVLSGDGKTARFPLDLQYFEDGGWYWFDLTTADADVTLLHGGWFSPAEAPGRASVAIGICTFNRPDDCVAALTALGEDAEVTDAIEAMIVTDQGNRKVRDADGFAAAAAALGDKLRIHDQPNLGGSGGFARVMHEAMSRTDCEQILLMDDDIVIEPDSVLRLIAFSRFAEHPAIVGGHMLNLQARSELRAMGEVVDHSRFVWAPAPNVRYDHDFARKPLRSKASRKLHRRVDVEYNGWWMCLIPRVVAEKMGLPLPLFIKWDDSEYSLRAQEAGHPTVSLPGAAVWHMPWSNKDDAKDWQAYFHLRNRLVVAALHGDFERPTAMIKSNLKGTLAHLMSLEYSTVALQLMGLRDFLKGPDALFGSLPVALAQARQERAKFPDGVVLPSAKDLPMPSMHPAQAASMLRKPKGPIRYGLRLLRGLVHNVVPVKREHHQRPQLNVAAQDARWYLLSQLDGVTVGTADGRGVVYRKRDPQVFWHLLRQSVALHARLGREFPRLRRQYREAMPRLTGAKGWTNVFEADGR